MHCRRISIRILASAVGVIAATLVVATQTAHADYTRSTNCFAGSCITTFRWGAPGSSIASIKHVDGPQTDEERAEAAEKDRRWVAHCRPALREDRFGMKRYVYAAAGCEFGKSN